MDSKDIWNIQPICLKKVQLKGLLIFIKRIIKSFLENPDTPTSELDIISEEEVRLISDWNNTDHEYTSDICLHQKFEQQVQKTPDSPALLFGNSSMTYSEFNLHINRLANHLIDSGTMLKILFVFVWSVLRN